MNQQKSKYLAINRFNLVPKTSLTAALAIAVVAMGTSLEAATVLTLDNVNQSGSILSGT